MKKVVSILILFIVLTLISWIIYINLPVEIARKADIIYGSELTKKIDEYYEANQVLPESNDWETLEKIGFEFQDWVCIPEYSKINETEYELIFVEGFDAPYLLYNSKTKQWIIGNPKTPKKIEIEMELDFPWSKNVTNSAIQAILKSIDNINQHSQYKGNFPTDINNMPFVRKEKTDFVVVGYSTSDLTPDNYQIDFHPKDEYDSGPRYTVEINIKTEEAIRVYMTPDA